VALAELLPDMVRTYVARLEDPKSETLDDYAVTLPGSRTQPKETAPEPARMRGVPRRAFVRSPGRHWGHALSRRLSRLPTPALPGLLFPSARAIVLATKAEDTLDVR
jgi:hypothetical protein